MEISGAEFRTWCACDAVEIASALGSDAARTECAVCGKTISFDTRAG
jgi:hypothetical protein